MKWNVKALALVLALSACSGGDESEPQQSAARDSAVPPAHDMSAMTDTAADTTAMSGMDHSNMPGMQSGQPMPDMQHGGKTTGGSMAGMDHSQMQSARGRGEQAMAGMDHSQMRTTTPRGQQSMAGMDHSQMNMPAARQQPTPQMDHSRMNMQPTPGATTQMQHQMPMPQSQPGRTNPPAGMQMAPPEDPPEPEDVALEKIRALVAELVRDPRIQTRIQADTVLRRLWQDPGVQQYLMKRP